MLKNDESVISKLETPPKLKNPPSFALPLPEFKPPTPALVN